MSISVNEPYKDPEELVRERAHQIWLDREAKGEPGTAEADWHLAELELEHPKKVPA